MELQLKRVRKENGISQAELAQKLGVDIKTVGNWERGNTVPDAIQLVKCAALLGTTPNELMGWYIDHPEDRPNAGAKTAAKLVSSYDSLSDEGREVAVNVVGALATSYPRPSPEKLGGGGRQCHPLTPLPSAA